MINMIYNQLSDCYNEKYIENIIDFQCKMQSDNPDTKYFVDFYPSFGINKNEKSDFLILGQALNGWSNGFYIDKVIEKDKLFESIKASNRYFIGDNYIYTPLDFVNVFWTKSSYETNTQNDRLRMFYNNSTNYRAFKSFFWQTMYKLIADYYGLNRSSWDWSRKLVWSNLYKIAPNNSNPNKLQKEYQKQNSCELIKLEIDEIKPKFCVVLTNLDWWLPFGDYLSTEKLVFHDYYSNILSVERYNETLIIITKRPRFGNSDLFVKQIFDVINNNGG